MAELPYMQFFPADYLRDTEILSLVAQGAWMRVICSAWHPSRRGVLSLHLPAMARLFHVSEKLARKIVDEIAEARVGEVQWSADSRRVSLRCRRMERDWERLAARHSALSEAGARGAAKRWGTQSTGPEKPEAGRKSAATGGKNKAVHSTPKLPAGLTRRPGFAAEWKEFRKHRRKKGDAMTPRAEELMLADLAERPHLAIAALQEAIKAGWKGIRWDWLEQRNPKVFRVPAPTSGGKSRLAILRKAVEKHGAGVFHDFVHTYQTFPSGEDNYRKARESILVAFLHSRGERA
ncbi:MAG TPA: hypothetical protein VNB29_09190 [Chthoniobacterales bacterium]|nr:hypothetical protein [Chthoniobacterales bacterium]